MEILIENKKTYDSLAQEYEEKAKVRDEISQLIISKFIKNMKTGNNVLDIGCAIGLQTSIFRAYRYNVTGIEISDEMVKYAKKRNPESNIIVGDFMKYKFKDKFDAIFAQAFIHLYPEKEVNNVIGKIRELLKVDGVALITTTKSNESKEGWYVKTDYSGNKKRFRKHWTKEELENKLKECNFKIIDYYEMTDTFNKEFMIFTVRK